MELYLALPAAFAALLLELVVGSALALLLVEAQLEVGTGFLQFMAVTLVVVMALVLAVAVSPWLVAALFAGIAYAVAAFRPMQGVRVASGVALGGFGAGALASTVGMGAASAVSFGAASVALGASMTGMLLGHWYLVSPMLSSRPLIRVTLLMIGALLVQAAVLVSFAGAAELERFGPVVLMRGAFGIVFPLVMAGFVWYACRIRAMRTATGILYLAAGCVLMGDVAAKVVYFATSVAL